MRLLLYAIGLILCLGVTGGCEKKKEVTKVLLPDSTMVGRNLPLISGSLAEFIDVPPASYVLDLQDSIPRLTIKFRVVKAKETSSMMVSEILMDSTYITLIDSLRQDIPTVVLHPDSSQIKTLNKLLEKEGMYGELTFVGEKVTSGFKDTLNAQARNFHLYGALGYQLKEADINVILNKWESALRLLNRSVCSPGFVPGNYINDYKWSFEDANRYRRLLEDCTKLMDEAQLKRFNSLNKRTPRKSLL